MGYRLGIDVGGTFTDFLIVGDDERSRVHKTLSTPDDPSDAVFAGLGYLAREDGVALDEFLGSVDSIVHGTTITTNATLTGTGSKVGFLTTRGFRDVLLMRRGMRQRQYDCKQSQPPPLVPRHRICEVSERVGYDGSSVVELDEQDVHAAGEFFRSSNVESVAVSYLFSFFDPRHEERTRELLAEHVPDAYVTLSSEVLPQVRLYERNSTTALNAYVGPVLERYLERLQERLAEHGFRGRLLIMQSNGGVMDPDVASRFAVNTLLSGPAAGPVAALAAASTLGEDNLMTIDMGGTSFDACLVAAGEPVLTNASELAGHHIAAPSLDMHVIGAGGGSIAWLDAGGGLHVGPNSAGADPGPACYGRGGPATVTDADLVLGYLDPKYFHGGALELDRAAAEAALRIIADELGTDLVGAAAGIRDIVDANMADGLRIISTQRGYDPRDFTLVAAGGAGPLHAAALAQELEVPLTIVPRDASVLCALGMLLTDLKHNYVRTFSAPNDAIDPAGVQACLDAMHAEATETLRAEQVDTPDIDVSFAADIRYIGQFSEVEVPLAPMNGQVSQATLDRAFSLFHELHDARYGYALPDSPTEIVNLRARSRGAIAKPDIASSRSSSERAGVARKGTRPAHFGTGFVEATVFDALRLPSGSRIDGPAILEQATTALLTPPGFQVTVADTGFLLAPADLDLDELLDGHRAAR